MDRDTGSANGSGMATVPSTDLPPMTGQNKLSLRPRSSACGDGFYVNASLGMMIYLLFTPLAHGWMATAPPGSGFITPSHAAFIAGMGISLCGKSIEPPHLEGRWQLAPCLDMIWWPLAFPLMPNELQLFLPTTNSASKGGRLRPPVRLTLHPPRKGFIWHG